jgi:hypothetical protein
MKYFTPELHARTCSANDTTANVAHAEWETALDRYERRLKKIRADLTPGVRKLIDDLRLHDAQLLYFGRSDDRCFLALQTDQAPETIVSLEYSLGANPIIERNALPTNLQTKGCFFLYDEVDLTTRNGRNAFTHSILFTDGLHIRLKFSDVIVRVVDPLVQVPQLSGKMALSRPA